MATPKKKHLIELMIEAGVKWPDGAEYAAQDKKDNKVQFYKNGKPNYLVGLDSWMADNCTYMRDDGITLQSLCRNWHQTIVTREQYEEALAASTPEVQQEEQPEPKYCASVMRQMPDNTIEQLTADYHAKAAEADRLQSVADEALKAADDALTTLQKAGEVIGLVISVATKPEQPNITDWRDLRVGDVIECVLVHGANGIESDESNNKFHGTECRVKGLTDAGINHIETDLKPHGCYIQEFKFIRRP